MCKGPQALLGADGKAKRVGVGGGGGGEEGTKSDGSRTDSRKSMPTGLEGRSVRRNTGFGRRGCYPLSPPSSARISLVTW